VPAAAAINLRPTVRLSDSAPVCSKIMTKIKMVASISRLSKDDPNRVSASLVPCLAVRKKLNVPRDFLTRQHEQDEPARRKRRYFRLNSRMSEPTLKQINAGI